MELEFNTPIIVGIVVSVVILFIILVTIVICIRRCKTKNYKRAPIFKENDSFAKQKQSLVEKNDTILNIPDLKVSPENDFNSDSYRFLGLGISLSDIPFIDDSKCSSYVDLTWSPYSYKPLINSNNA